MYVTFNIQFGNFFISESLSASSLKGQMGTRYDYAKRLLLGCNYNRKSTTLCMLSDLIVTDMCSLKTISKQRLLNEGDIPQFYLSVLTLERCFLSQWFSWGICPKIWVLSLLKHNPQILQTRAQWWLFELIEWKKKTLIGGRQQIN